MAFIDSKDLESIFNNIKSLIKENDDLKTKLNAYETDKDINNLILYHYEVDDCEINAKGYVISDKAENVKKIISDNYFVHRDNEIKINKIMNVRDIYKLLVDKKIEYFYCD